MKSILLFLTVSTALLAQPVSFGLKGGVPLTDFIDTVSGSKTSITTTTNRYIVGPTIELRLPAGFGVEADALYRHFNFSSTSNLVDAISTLTTTTGAWEFPILLKKRFLPGPVRPFVSAGVNFNKITGLSQTLSTLSGNPASGSNSAGLKDDFSSGFTMGGGVEVKALLLRITPEIRYTRWSTQHFNSVNASSNLNQAEFLVGFTF
jgi:opacity protein-like surface antigen